VTGQAESQGEARQPRRIRVPPLLLMAATVVVLAFAAIFAGVSYSEYREAYAEAARNSGNIARTLEQHTVRAIGGVDLLLTGIAERMAIVGRTGDVAATHDFLARRLRLMPFLRRIDVLGPHGRLRATSSEEAALGEDHAGDEIFLAQHDAGAPALTIGLPQRLPGTERWSLPVSRALRDAAGNFAGVAVAFVDIDFLETFYRSLDLGPHGAMALFRRDGYLLINRPFDPMRVGTSFAERPLFHDHLAQQSWGFSRSDAVAPGAHHLVAFRTIADIPLVIAVALDETDVLGAWRDNVSGHIFAVAAIAAITFTFAIMLGQQWSRREAEEAARTAAERDYQSLFSNSPDALYRCDAQGEMLKVNHALLRLHGFEDEAAWQAAKIVIDDWYLQPGRWQEFRRRLLRDGTVSNFVSEMVRLNSGERIWVSENAQAVYDSAGRLRYYDGSIRDITRLRGADEALRAATAETERANRLLGERNRQFDIALAHIRQGLALHDGDDRLLVCNSRFAEIFALPAELTRPGVARRAILDHILGRDGAGDPAAAGMHEKHLRIAASERRQVFFQRLPGGRVIEIVHQPVPGFGAVQTFTDVTGHVRTQLALRESRRRLRERVRELEQIGERLAQQGSELTALAARLARARDEAEAASRTKSNFLANMSHELRTPLNAIIGFSEVMKDEVFGPIGSRRYRDYAQDVHDSGTHLLALINEILDLAKVESGRLEIRESEIALPRVLGACHRLMKERAAEARLEFLLLPLPPLPPLFADEIRVKQILLNLLSNAIKFTPAGGRVTLGAAQNEHGDIALWVRDTGIGMRPEDIPRALEPFGQVEAMSLRREEGTGLGLSLTKALIELHGGGLAIDSTPGAGTTVTVSFPAWRSRGTARVAVG